MKGGMGLRPNTFALSTNSIQSDCRVPVLAPVLAPTRGAVLVPSLAPSSGPNSGPNPAPIPVPIPAPIPAPIFCATEQMARKAQFTLCFWRFRSSMGGCKNLGPELGPELGPVWAGIGAGIGGRDCSTVSAAIGVATSSSLRCDRPVAGAWCRRLGAAVLWPAPHCRCLGSVAPVATIPLPPLTSRRPGACGPVGSALLSLPSCRRPIASSQMPLSRGCRCIGQPWPALAIGHRNKIIS